MDCPTCVKKVETSLDRVEGVIDSTLQPTTGTASVTFDPERTTESAVIEAIEGAGYEVSAVSAADSDGAGGSAGSHRDGSGADTDVEVAPPNEVWTSQRAKKTWVGAVFLVAGLLVEFVLSGLNPTVGQVLGVPISVAAVFFLVAIATSGAPVVRGGYYSARNDSLDIDLLMGVAILAATAIGFFVEAATLAVLFSIAELLEDYAMDRARDSLRELLALSPDEATVIREGETMTVQAEDVSLGETVAVRPGEKIPLDGRVTAGESAVDESPITGESVPVEKGPGDEVFAGAINESGYLELEVTSLSSDSTLARIIEMVQGAQAERTETERFVDRFAGYYTPTVVVLALLTATLPPLLIVTPIPVDVAGYTITFAGDWRTWFIRGLTLLVIACPCAFVISTPVSVVSAVTSAAKNGVLVKGGSHLEAMGRVDTVAFDKTGTLTAGNLAVTDILPMGGTDESTVLGLAAALERRSTHPIGAAVLERAESARLAPPEPTTFENLAGRGIRGEIDGKTAMVGKPALFEDHGFDLSGPVLPDGGPLADAQRSEETGTQGFVDAIGDLERDGKTVILVGHGDELLGAIAVADEVRPNAARAVDRLCDLGIDRVVMLTGDNEATARAIAEQVGVDEFRAELLPEQKVEAVESLQSSGEAVAMVGDGINDAPALATAEVGIAMGAAGTDTALETADIALMGDEIGRIPYLYALSRTANGVIRQNVWASLGVKALLALGVPLGLVSVALAVVVGDMGMSLGVTGNAMRLSGITPERFD
ncbi:MAG: heavy metal translocating P-type ATPase [Halodesulfurarchaeum sp.]